MRDWATTPLRTMLFVPGSDERKLRKARILDADTVVLDLEDAVTPDRKAAARNLIRAELPGLSNDTRAAVGVRINPVGTALWRDDLRAVACDSLDFVIVPKTEHADQLREVDALLTGLEAELGVERGGIGMFASIETPLGVLRCGEISLAAPERLLTFAFGPVDLAADLGLDLTEQGLELLYARSQVVVAARAGGRLPAIDGPYLALDDLVGLEATTSRSRQLGFQGRVVIHPDQLHPVAQIFSELSEAELAHARRIVDAFSAVEQEGVASIAVEGQFVDYPVYHRARRKLMLHELLRGSVNGSEDAQ
jgi:citrate lyase subunit beta/citryl-CoA lyase